MVAETESKVRVTDSEIAKALSPDETRLYAANGLSSDLSVIDLANGRSIRTLKLGGRPWGLVTTR